MVTHHAHHAADRPALRVAVMTVSDTRSRDDDAGGDGVARVLTEGGHDVAGRAWERDEVIPIQTTAFQLLEAADALVVTGGTGLAERDVTPEAFADLFEKPWPGFGERFRALSVEQVGELAALSRASAGLVRANGRLKPVFLVPGAPEGARLATERLIVPLLPHVAGLLHARHG